MSRRDALKIFGTPESPIAISRAASTSLYALRWLVLSNVPHIRRIFFSSGRDEGGGCCPTLLVSVELEPYALLTFGLLHRRIKRRVQELLTRELPDVQVKVQ